jgi:cellulose synthase/poly-beta-1,6-N-acetylglucosamine synthase-like glycosyltransferase
MHWAVLFWISVSFIGYVYVGYPLLLWAWQRVRGRSVRKAYVQPSVSIVIAAHNERDRIEAKIHNCLALDYPRNRLQVIVSLDGPTDGTDEIVLRHSAEVDVVRSTRRQGKAAALNRGVRLARGEILLFADVRQRLDPRVVRELVADFADPSVGAVTGELVLVDEAGRESSNAAGLYWRYEKRIRALESAVHSVVGATGAIYAIRRALFHPLPPDTILDDVVVPMRLVLRGWRSVFDPAARAYDPLECSIETEYGRKVRTLVGNYQLLALMPELLSPRRNPVLVQFVSHKVARLLVPYFLAALLLSNLFLRDGLYLVALIGQGAWYALVATGALLARSGGRPAPVAGGAQHIVGWRH